MKTAYLCLAAAVGGVPAASAQVAGPAASVPATSSPLQGNAPGAGGALIIDRGRVDRQPVATPDAGPPSSPRGHVEAAGAVSSSTARLRKVRVEGSHAPLRILDRATRRFIGHPLDADTVKAIAGAISTAYEKGDVALYTVVVPQQDLDNGLLTIRVVEGYIDDVMITGDTDGRDMSLVRGYAAKLVAERPLRRQVLERYLSLIRDIPGLKVDVKLLNLNAPGAVRLVLDVHPDDVEFNLSINNRGTANLGRVQVQPSLSFNGLLKQGDQTSVTVALPTEIKRFQYYSISHSTPLGHEGLRLGLNAGYLRTRPEGYGYVIKGKAKSAGATLSYPLRRSYHDNVYVSLGLDGLDSDNAAFGQQIASDHTRAVRAAASWSHATERSFASASLTASKGLDILDAHADPRLTQLGFFKINGQIGYNQMIGKQWVVRLSATGQWSEDRLPASEFFSLGGEPVGRGFPYAYVTADRGYGGSAEVAWLAESLWPSMLKGSEIYGFVDGGRARLSPRFSGLLPAQHYRLASAGGGVRLNFGKKTIVGLEAAKPVKRPYQMTSNDWRFTISWRSIR